MAGKSTVMAVAFLLFLGLSSISWAVDAPYLNLYSPVDEYVVHHWPDPVNVRNGTLILRFSDIRIPYMGRSLRVARRYNSALKSVGCFGYGWRANFELQLKARGPNRIDVFESNGGRTVYRKSETDGGRSVYLSSTRRSRIVHDPGERVYVRLLSCDYQEIFDENGRLVGVSDVWGNSINVKYRNGRVSQISDGAGRSLVLKYTGSGLVSSVTDPAKRVFHYYYDVEKNLIRTEHPGGSQTAFTYDEQHRVVGIRYPAGGRTVIRYDQKSGRVIAESGPGDKKTRLSYRIERKKPLKQVTRVTDALGNRTEYLYEESPNGLSLTITDALGGKTVKVYDKVGNLVSVKDPNGGKTRFYYYYDTSGFLTEITDAAGQTTAFAESHECGGVSSASTTYPDGNRISWTTDSVELTSEAIDPLGRMRIEKLNERGRVSSIIDQSGKRINLKYDRYGNLTGIITASGRKVDLEHDILGKLTRVNVAGEQTIKIDYDEALRISSLQRPDGRKTRFFYDGGGRIAKIDKGEGIIVKFIRDESGQLTGKIDEAGSRTLFTYDAAGNCISMVDARGNRTAQYYDSLNRLVKWVDRAGKQYLLKRDAVGHVVSLQMPSGRKRTFRYDALGRLIESVQPSGATRKFRYDRVGNLVWEQLPDESAVRYCYDPIGRLLEFIPPSGRSWKFKYAPRGNGSIIVDGNGRKHTLRWNAEGNLIAEIDPNGKKKTYKYDDMGRLENTWDYHGVATRYKYDVHKRVVEITISDTATGETLRKRRFQYDAQNRIIRVQDGEDFVECRRDELGRITRVHNSITGHSVRYLRDANGNITKVFANGQLMASRSYDELDRLESMKNAWGDEFRFSYGDNWGPSKLVYPNKVTALYGYDPDGRLQQLAYRDPSGKELISFRYRYDRRGNVAEVHESKDVTRYAYDHSGRLVRITGPAGVQVFQYDGSDNLITRKGNSGKQETLSYNRQDQLTGWGGASFLYDKKGSMELMKDSRGAKRFVYDVYNRLVLVVLPDGREIRFRYDPMGKRIMKSGPAGAVYYAYSGMDLAWELDERGRVTASFTHGPSVDQPLAVRRGDESFFYHTDILGSVRLVTDEAGRVVRKLRYTTFGAIDGEDDSRWAPYRFVGRVFDPETGLYYFRNRYYMPEIGRFIGKDPLGYVSGDNNYYAYANNNPISMRDPLGLQSELDDITGFAGVKVSTWLFEGKIQVEYSGEKGIDVNVGAKLQAKLGQTFSVSLVEGFRDPTVAGPTVPQLEADLSFGVSGASTKYDPLSGNLSHVGLSVGPITLNEYVNPETGEPREYRGELKIDPVNPGFKFGFSYDIPIDKVLEATVGEGILPWAVRKTGEGIREGYEGLFIDRWKSLEEGLKGCPK